MRTRLICLGAVACAVALAQPAAAQVQPAGTGEPLFTNSAQNTQFFEWPARAPASTRTRSSTATTRTTPRSPRRPSTTARAPAARWANWSGVANAPARRPVRHLRPGPLLVHQRLAVLSPTARTRARWARCSAAARYTTIDRSKPTAAITLAGGAAVHEGRQGRAEGRLLRRRRGPVPGELRLLPVRRRPGRPVRQAPGLHLRLQRRPARCPRGAGKSTSFNCTADYGSGASPAPDGPVWACVRAADAAIPDNPSSANQSGSADKANLSDPSATASCSTAPRRPRRSRRPRPR